MGDANLDGIALPEKNVDAALYLGYITGL